MTTLTVGMVISVDAAGRHEDTTLVFISIRDGGMKGSQSIFLNNMINQFKI
nr:hypothetical protein [Chitinophagaceae bacterium]